MGTSKSNRRQNHNQDGKLTKSTELSSISPEDQKAILEEASDRANKSVSKLAEKWAKMDLKGQVKVASGMARRAGVANFKSGFIPGFREDLMDKATEGATNDEIFDYYFSCPEFVYFWTGLLGMNKSEFRALLPVTLDSIKPDSSTDSPTPNDSTPNDSETTDTPKPGLKSRIKRWLSNKKEQAKIAQVTLQSKQDERIEKTLDSVIERKITMFKNKGVPLTMNRLMTGSGPIIKLGVTEDTIRDLIAKKITEMGETLVEEDK